MYDYYSHNPYRYEKQLLDGINQFDFSSPEMDSSLTDEQKGKSYLKNFWENDENKLATANLGLGILGTIGNNLQYNREYKDNMRRRGDEYTQIPYDRNSYRSYATDFYQSYQTGGMYQTGGEIEPTDLWNHTDYSSEDSVIDDIFNEMFKDYDLSEPEEYEPVGYSNDYTPPRQYSMQSQRQSSSGEYAFNYLKSIGQPANVAAAIVGNLKQESNLDPNAIGDNGASYGLAQWQGNRRKQLHQRYGLNPSVEQQLDFLVSEPGESKVLEQMRNLSPEEGALYFAKKYERPNPKYAHYDKRQQYASQYK